MIIFFKNQPGTINTCIEFKLNETQSYKCRPMVVMSDKASNDTTLKWNLNLYL